MNEDEALKPCKIHLAIENVLRLRRWTPLADMPMDEKRQKYFDVYNDTNGSQRAIADRHQVSVSSVSKIKNGLLGAEVTGHTRIDGR